jgi:hypothetical protein
MEPFTILLTFLIVMLIIGSILYFHCRGECIKQSEPPIRVGDKYTDSTGEIIIVTIIDNHYNRIWYFRFTECYPAGYLTWTYASDFRRRFTIKLDKDGEE